MTAAALVPTRGKSREDSLTVAGMDGIARLAARLTAATAAAVVLGAGDDRRVAARAGDESVAVLGVGAVAPSAVAALIAPDGAVRGSLEVFGGRTAATDATPDVAVAGLLSDLAAQAAALLELERMSAELARLAGSDPLTGLPTRRTLEQAIGAAVTRAERGLGTPSVVVVDLDDFSAVNAALGEDAADSVLRSVGERLLASARAVDTVARLGGDGFAVLLEHTGGPGATAALRRLKDSLEGGWTEHEAAGAHVRASLGITTYRPGDSVASLIARADAEMFADQARHG